MGKIMSKPEYERWTASTRDQRMEWWREARFGMFVHYGIFSAIGRHEWAMVQENFPIEEYEKHANEFLPKEGACREWAKLAKAAGMKYMVMTTRHHEGFSLWDSKVNPYNSVNYGPHRDIVREFVDACREFDLKIGFYSTCMEWHHPDSWKCANDKEARRRFTDYIKALNTELLTNYGKIDILWYDVPLPMENWEGWDSLERNQYLRSLQPDIIINDRSRLDEDFGTPEEHVTPESRDWEARRRFTDYIKALNTELLTNYGKIDILWYDVPLPMENWEGWDSLERNQYLRSLQPDIIINDRSRLDEDFGTPEEHVTPESRDWEACMTFNGISWGYVDSEMAKPYSYNAQRIINMLNTCAANGGNLLLNIGPMPDGSVPEEAVEPLTQVGKWLEENGEAVYGKVRRQRGFTTSAFGGNGISRASSKGNHVYLWNQIWPKNGEMGIGGYLEAPKKISLLKDGTPIDFEFKGNRILLKNLPKEVPDTIAGVTVIDMEFENEPKYIFASYYPQLHGGEDFAGDQKI